MQIKNLVIERALQNAVINKKLIVLISWNMTNPVGTALVRYNEKCEIVADVTFKDRMIPEEIIGLYPAIGFKNEAGIATLVNLSFCAGPNEDESIPPVSIEDFDIPFDDKKYNDLDRHWLFTIVKTPVNHPDQATYTTGTLENVHPFQHMTKLSKSSSAYQYSLILCEEITPFDYKLFFH